MVVQSGGTASPTARGREGHALRGLVRRSAGDGHGDDGCQGTLRDHRPDLNKAEGSSTRQQRWASASSSSPSSARRCPSRRLSTNSPRWPRAMRWHSSTTGAKSRATRSRSARRGHERQRRRPWNRGVVSMLRPRRTAERDDLLASTRALANLLALLCREPRLHDGAILAMTRPPRGSAALHRGGCRQPGSSESERRPE